MTDATFSALCGVCQNVSFRKRSWAATSGKREDTRRARARSAFEQRDRILDTISLGSVMSVAGAMAPRS